MAWTAPEELVALPGTRGRAVAEHRLGRQADAGLSPEAAIPIVIGQRQSRVEKVIGLTLSWNAAEAYLGQRRQFLQRYEFSPSTVQQPH